MGSEIDAAMIGLWGVILGTLLSLVGTVVVPWMRDSSDRRRTERQVLATERRDLTLAAMAALLEMRHARGLEPATGVAQSNFGARLNELTVRLTPEEQPILDVLLLMLVIVQGGAHDVPNLVGEAMAVLTRWVRGDIGTEDVISEVERRASVKFSADRKQVVRVP